MAEEAVKTEVVEEATKAEETKTDEVVEDTAKSEEEKKEYTQKEIDEIVQKRLDRERKKAEKKAKDEEAAKKETEDSEEVAKLKATIKSQNDRIMKNEAKGLASELNIDKDFIDAAIALTDFSEVDIENNDYVDDIKEALQGVIDKYPKFLAKNTETTDNKEQTGQIRAGVENNNNSKNQSLMDQVLKGFGF